MLRFTMLWTLEWDFMYTFTNDFVQASLRVIGTLPNAYLETAADSL